MTGIVPEWGRAEPGRLVGAAKPVWPHSQLISFHYPHPLTGA